MQRLEIRRLRLEKQLQKMKHQRRQEQARITKLRRESENIEASKAHALASGTDDSASDSTFGDDMGSVVSEQPKKPGKKKATAAEKHLKELQRSLAAQEVEVEAQRLVAEHERRLREVQTAHLQQLLDAERAKARAAAATHASTSLTSVVEDVGEMHRGEMPVSSF